MPPRVPRLAGPLGDEAMAVQEAMRSHLELMAQLVLTIGLPTAVKNENYVARAGDLVLVDPTQGAFTVYLPGINRFNLGQFVQIKEVGGSQNSVTVRPADADATIDGEASIVMDNARGCVTLQALTPTLWGVMAGRIGKSRGAYYVSSSSGTTITVADTYYKMAGTTTERGEIKDFTHTDNRLTYNGKNDKRFHINISHSSSYNSGAAIEAHYAIAVNGAVETPSIIDRKLSTPTDHGAASNNWKVTLSEDDYIEVWVTADRSGVVLTGDHVMVTVSEDD